MPQCNFSNKFLLPKLPGFSAPRGAGHSVYQTQQGVTSKQRRFWGAASRGHARPALDLRPLRAEVTRISSTCSRIQSEQGCGFLYLFLRSRCSKAECCPHLSLFFLVLSKMTPRGIWNSSLWLPTPQWAFPQLKMFCMNMLTVWASFQNLTVKNFVKRILIQQRGEQWGAGS